MGYQSVFRAGLFDGQVGLITGGGTGIGRCVAHELASLGAHVVLAGRRTEPLDRTVAEIVEDGGQASAVPLNIREQEDVDRAIAGLVAEHGRLDLLFNNAGGQFVSDAAAIRPKGWRAVIDTNLNGTWWVTQAAFQHAMSERGGAVVMMVADMWNGFPGMAHTGAARAAVVNLTKTLGVEWASHGVRVNAVAPGGILSSGMTTYPPEVLALVADQLRKNPSARMGTEAEVASAVTFLLSPAAAYITGTTVRVDGASSLAKSPLMPLEPHTRMPVWNGFHRPTELPPELRADAGDGSPGGADEAG
jgi:citronellol/citronellal dehydrogenase